jgi:uncharacterized hydrophobic protein (TIGR00271 family)
MVSFFKGFSENTRKKGVIDLLITQSETNVSYFFLLSIATIITTLGLTLNSVATVVGGMLIAPLLTPMLALGLGITTGSPKSISRSLVGIISSISIVLFWAFIVSLLIHSDGYLTDQILMRGEYSHLYLIIAILSGLAATYTWMQPMLASALPGVAVAVSLLPPLCVSGIAMAQTNKDLLLNSLQIFGSNVVGIIAAATLLFFIFKFSKFKKFEEEKIAKIDEQPDTGKS